MCDERISYQKKKIPEKWGEKKRKSGKIVGQEEKQSWGENAVGQR